MEEEQEQKQQQRQRQPTKRIYDNYYDNDSFPRQRLEQTQQRQRQKRIFEVTEGIRSAKTAVVYQRIFKRFLNHIKIHDLEVLLDYSKTRPQIIKEMLVDYILYLRDEKPGNKLTRSSIKLHLAAILHFFQINNDDFNLTIRNFRIHLPSDEIVNNDDRLYTHAEILQILKACDVRSRMMILLLCSTGMRIGALRTLQIGDITEVSPLSLSLSLNNNNNNNNNNNFNLPLLLYKIQVYARTRDRYITFCTPECYNAIEEYLEYRRKSGETLTNKAPLIREQFNIDNPFTINAPKLLSDDAMRYIIKQVVQRSGVYNQSKREVHLSHGMRKFFMTQCEHAGMKSLNVEMLLGHNVGLAGHYYRPAETDLLEDYMTHAADSLTIDPNLRLQKQVTRLESEKSEEMARLKADLAKLRVENQEAATTIYEHNLVLKNLNDNFKKQQAEHDKQFHVEMNTKLYERNNDIAELKAAVAFLADKVNAAIIANEPSSKVIFNQKGIPSIKIPALNNNTATAPLAKITEENQESATTTCTQSNLKQSK